MVKIPAKDILHNSLCFLPMKKWISWEWCFLVSESFLLSSTLFQFWITIFQKSFNVQAFHFSKPNLVAFLFWPSFTYFKLSFKSLIITFPVNLPNLSFSMFLFIIDCLSSYEIAFGCGNLTGTSSMSADFQKLPAHCCHDNVVKTDSSKKKLPIPTNDDNIGQ